ncbi:MAG: hypothetical protein HOL29_08830 [Euryarchaeota archaeon]|jgi:hypothetical protein|nr:hypothetical protein [Euryarchaeota archaeon]
MVETADDRLIMLSDFGEQITYSPIGGDSKTVTAIFDQVYESVEVGGSVPIAMSQPRLTLRTADVEGVEEGDGFVVRSLTYAVTIVMADGTGITEIALEAQ